MRAAGLHAIETVLTTEAVLIKSSRPCPISPLSPVSPNGNSVNGTSPAKFSRNNADFATGGFTRDQARGELRDTMKGKVNSVTPARLMSLFMHDFYPKRNDNIFANPPEFKTETEMYEWIVSSILCLQGYMHGSKV